MKTTILNSKDGSPVQTGQLIAVSMANLKIKEFDFATNKIVVKIMGRWIRFDITQLLEMLEGKEKIAMGQI